jgi:hypothetical protein
MALVQYAQARRLEYNAYAKECSSDTGGSSSAKSLKSARKPRVMDSRSA